MKHATANRINSTALACRPWQDIHQFGSWPRGWGERSHKHGYHLPVDIGLSSWFRPRHFGRAIAGIHSPHASLKHSAAVRRTSPLSRLYAPGTTSTGNPRSSSRLRHPTSPPHPISRLRYELCLACTAHPHYGACPKCYVLSIHLQLYLLSRSCPMRTVALIERLTSFAEISLIACATRANRSHHSMRWPSYSVELPLARTGWEAHYTAGARLGSRLEVDAEADSERESEAGGEYLVAFRSMRYLRAISVDCQCHARKLLNDVHGHAESTMQSPPYSVSLIGDLHECAG
ncbi:uncharacterized protein C8Q71DRAFT_280417 [Rhodofomes roseus]|uniref:Uncharacterized protein n=1 Tax=Rhodofomes roseus TaxID=34475 RepID=A0ABQ8K6E9_9APHY|nr:uncharacterized protein C8Q71DRAFT_280417 [Rhodofomes roseus]KAH9832071.1 hypothetical protein C8Q71DRAFT_280417 [Rhodofomes roseus]